MGPLTARFTRHQSRERGISLIMALISLFILTLSALAMMMLMKGSGSTAANIAFRQAAVRVADTAAWFEAEGNFHAPGTEVRLGRDYEMHSRCELLLVEKPVGPAKK